MDKKRLLILIIPILMVLVIPFIIYLYNFNSIAFNEDLYKEEFSKYDIYNDLKNYDIEEINNDVLNYLMNGKNNLIKNNFFNAREKTHLLDVKNLIQTIINIYYISLILFIILIIILITLLNFNFRNIGKKLLIILAIGSLLTLLGTVLFFISSSLNFDFTFDLFHKTFFIPGTFTFNPEFENIVVLYPQDLFFDFLIKIISNTLLSSIILFSVSIILFSIFFRPNLRIFFKKLPTIKIKNRKV
ncbi:MAG: DUF1461 domain-containing protein [Nanoarchaeota archaeon]|nr:DUF1461 domain-containing protein [Nanoarchaeota archaeon]